MNLIRISALAMLSAAWLIFSSEASTLEGSRPNIILVMTDDQGYGDLSCHGHPFLKTPHIDELYAASTRFTDFMVSPTCAPTRAALMSGKAPFKNGVTHTILERERMALSSVTIAEVLKGAGYATGIFGKWHLGDADPYQPGSRGFDEVFIHAAGGIGQNFPGTQGAIPGTSYFDPYLKHNDQIVKTEGYCTDVYFDQAMVWIEEQKEEDNPFFAYIPTNAPHGPFIVADEYKEPFKEHTDNDQTQAFFGMIVNIDDNMGRLMAKLDEWDLADDTLLIFMTDNGSSKGSRIFNAGMKGGKGSVNQGGSRVPFILRLPGKIEAGVDIDRMTRHVDVFPTFAALAGTEIPEEVDLDGRSLLPLIEDPEAEWSDRYTFFHAGRWAKAGAPDKWGQGITDPDESKYSKFAVRNERWRLVGEEELYDLDNDPGETTNVFEQHPEVAAEMLNAFDAWWEEVRPLMVNEDAPLDTGKPFVELYEKQKAAGGIPTWEKPDF